MSVASIRMRAGTLRFRVSIEKPTDPPTRSASGAVIKTWDLVVENVPANIQPLSGTEKWDAETKSYITGATSVIIIRYFADLTNKMRIVYGTRTFDILDITDVAERHRVMELQCREGLSKGN